MESRAIPAEFTRMFFFRPFGACYPRPFLDPRLAPWAAFWRRFAAGVGVFCDIDRSGEVCA